MKGKPLKTKLLVLLRRVLLVLVALFVGLSIYTWNAASLMGNQLPMPLGFGMAVVLTGSMEPNIGIDSLIFVRQSDDLAVGDVVVYQSGNSLVVHRIVALEGQTVTTQGDANNAPDEPMDISAIKGEVMFHIPHVGLVVRGMKTPVGFVCVLAAAVILLELSYRKERKTDDDELEKLKEEIRKLKDE